MSISRILAAVIQNQDSECATDALEEAGFQVTKLASSGGFLGSQNVTLLISLEDGQEEKAVAALSNRCRQRIEYITTPLEGAPFYLPFPTPINVGGATIFTLPVERYEAIK